MSAITQNTSEPSVATEVGSMEVRGNDVAVLTATEYVKSETEVSTQEDTVLTDVGVSTQEETVSTDVGVSTQEETVPADVGVFTQATEATVVAGDAVAQAAEPAEVSTHSRSSKKRHFDEIADAGSDGPTTPKRNGRSAINVLKSRLAWWHYSMMNDEKPSQATSLKLIMKASRATRAEIDSIEGFTVVEYFKRSFPYHLIDGGKPNACLPLNRDQPVVCYLAIKDIGNGLWKISSIARNVTPDDDDLVIVTNESVQ